MFVLFEEETLKILRTGSVRESIGAGLVSGELLRDDPPSYNSATQKIVQTASRDGDNLRLGWSVVSLTQAELDAKAAAAAAAAARAEALTEIAKTSEEIAKVKDIEEFKSVMTKQLQAIIRLLK